MVRIREHSREGLPALFRPILWSYDFSKINPLQDATLVIVQALNYGTLDHWRWIAEFYGVDRIRRILRDVPQTAVRPGARALAALLFSVTEFRHAPRGVA